MQEYQINQRRMGLDAIAVAICFAIAPVHGGLDLGYGASLNKYVSLAAMALVVLCSLGHLNLVNYLSEKFVPLTVWFGLSIVWAASTSAAITSFISFVSYFAFVSILCSKEWSLREKAFFRLLIVVADVYFAYILYSNMLNGAKRATIALTMAQTDADQNVLAVNLIFGAIIAIDIFIHSSNILKKLTSLAAGMAILVGILSTGSRGAVIAFVVAMIYYWRHNKNIDSRSRKYIFVAFLAVILLFSFLLLSDKSFLGEYLISRFTNIDEMAGGTGRSKIWSRYIGGLFRYPYFLIMGAGVGNATTVYKTYISSAYAAATHNDAILVLCMGGIPAFMMIVSVIKAVWWKSKWNEDVLGATCLIGLIIGCMDVNLITSFGFWNVLAMTYIGIGDRMYGWETM